MTDVIQQPQSWGQTIKRFFGWFVLAVGVVALFVPLVPSIPFFFVAGMALRA